MLDANVVACSAATVYRVLSDAGLLRRNLQRSSKGTGFHQPLLAHEHGHIDISYLNIAGTFSFMATILDGFSRSLVQWDIRHKMEEVDIEVLVQAAREKFPGVTPRIISDNGPQFIARDFKHFIRLCGMKHVRTSPYYPQSNGKIERCHRTIKSDCIRMLSPLCLEDAKRGVEKYVLEYNTLRLHSAIGYVTPTAMREGRQQAIFDERDRKLEEARALRARTRAAKVVSDQHRFPLSTFPLMAPCEKFRGFGGWPPSCRQNNVQFLLCPLQSYAIRSTRFHNLR